MQVSLVQIFLQFSIVCLLYMHAMAFSSNPIFRTKKPKYVMRGELRIPTTPEDYCRKGLCPAGVNHIACRNTFWAENCPKPREGVNLDKYYLEIIDEYNNLRDSISRVKVKLLPKAKNLVRLHWHQELSILAMRVTNFCNDDKASECVNTAHFLNVARSSFSFRVGNAKINPVDWVKNVIKNFWFKSNTVNETFILSFPPDPTDSDNNLANIVNKRVGYVGCGMLIQGSGKERKFYLTCLYNEKAKPGQKLYDLAIH